VTRLYMIVANQWCVHCCFTQMHLMSTTSAAAMLLETAACIVAESACQLLADLGRNVTLRISTLRNGVCVSLRRSTSGTVGGEV
jgi:hypothetical protein